MELCRKISGFMHQPGISTLIEHSLILLATQKDPYVANRTFTKLTVANKSKMVYMHPLNAESSIYI